MNTTQWRLYNFLKHKAELNPDHWVSQQEICDALPELFSMNHLAIKKKCSSMIQQQVIKINEDNTIEKIIMFKNQTYKLATTPEEALNFINQKLFQRGCNALRRYGQLRDKIFKNGQGKLLSNKGRAIDETSKARPYVEAFISQIQQEDQTRQTK